MKKITEKKKSLKKTSLKKQERKEEKKITKKRERPSKKEGEKEKEVKYIETIGRRKTATARVRLYTQKIKDILVNNKSYKTYFSDFSLQKKLEEPLGKLNCQGKFGFSILVKGGGISSQAEACRHGIARALVALNPYFKKRLKKAGYLTRDPRMRERKKFGLKRARRAPQWSKR